MSSPTVHFNITSNSSHKAIIVTKQTILIIDHLSPSSTPLPDDALEPGEVIPPLYDLEMSAKIIELAKVPIIEPKGSLNLLNNFANKLTPDAVATLAKAVTQAAVAKLNDEANWVAHHQKFVKGLRRQMDLCQSRIDGTILDTKTAWEKWLTTSLKALQAEHQNHVQVIKTGAKATITDLECCLHLYKKANTVECPEEFEEKHSCVPHFPIIIDSFTLQACYSGLENRCNVWKFWIDCDAALNSMGIMLSTGGVE